MRNKIFLIGIAVLALTTRLWGIGSFMTVDEENWMIRSSQFWHKVLQGDPGGTFMTTHPGATAMWLIGAGEIVQEQRIGMAVDTSTLPHFRLYATIPLAVATAALITFIAWLVYKITSSGVAWWAGLLLSIDPYIVGMGQIAHLDELLALFMLATVLATWWYLRSKLTLPAI